MEHQRRTTDGERAESVAVEAVAATPADQAWLEEHLHRTSTGRVLMRLDGEPDVSGHMAEGDDPRLLRIVIHDDELDTEGHAITMRLPSVEEANALRRRLILTGVLVGTVVLGGAGAVVAFSNAADGPQASATTDLVDISYEDATPNSGNV